MTQLSAALDVTARRMTTLVDALAEDGLVERYAHPTDRRSTIVELTDAGRAQQRRAWEGHQAGSHWRSAIYPTVNRCDCWTSAASSPPRFAGTWSNWPRAGRWPILIPTQR
jgi:hypothetical protein